ncbi:tRNA (cytosine(34)-C(5))-methyltransferase [Rhizophlyctis rosea]|uniref:tRNA (Cytosine(34)-C(5))-methyltransferase n=1 Tax=Rhizophlyctis rosea TaxID=64517 RepID=A0AAD5S7Z9_9FUNG|nr:tRNA (cytosine(34)-C(5))-methyltransferase [Rhizophlyctis rosea]
MTFRGRGKGKKRGGGGPQSGGRDWRDKPKKGEKGERTETRGYADQPLENEGFEKYYKAQGLFSEDEYKQWVDSLRTPLPSCFRITGSRSHAQELKDLMIEKYFKPLKSERESGQEVEIPTAIPWYPDELAWTAASRTALRKTPVWEKFHKFLVAETEVGNVSRQEAVSMIPVLLLDVKPEHFVIDMCAAPGSKAAQIIEAVHANDVAVPSGLVIANDADQKRAHMLVRQTGRLNSPALIVTNHEAQLFPAVYFREDRPEGGNTLQFDRILCDVPCAGDGTLRKNKPIWKTWNQNNGNALHGVQFNILRRACELLKVGGRVVYSTCSFNPVENEAVVAELLRRSEGAMELVDVSAELPSLIRKPGLTKWVVVAKDGKVFEKFEDVPKEKTYSKVFESFFPPGNASELGLEKCLRIYPHLQNTGGFFVAVLEKRRPYGRLDFGGGRGKSGAGIVDAGLEEEKEDEAGAPEGAPAIVPEPAKEAEPAPETPEPPKDTSTEKPATGAVDPKLQKVWSGAGENPFLFLSKDSPAVLDFEKHYGLKESFPRDQFVVRTEGDQHKIIYFVGRSVKDVLSAKNSQRLKIVNTGIRMFTRYAKSNPELLASVPCPYRINHDGLPILAPHLGENLRINVGLEDIKMLIKWEYPKFERLSEGVRRLVEALAQGSCLFEFDPSRETGDLGGTIHTKFDLPVWRGAASVSLLLNKQERKSLLHRLTGEELVGFEGGLEKDKDKKEAKKAEEDVEMGEDADDEETGKRKREVEEVEEEAEGKKVKVDEQAAE